MIQKSIPKRLLGLASIAVLAVACSTPGGSAAPSSAPAASESASAPAASESASASAAAQFKIGYSNGGGVGNGFREEQVCTAKAEALASGQVSELVTYPPEHGRRRPAVGHPRPDRGRRRRDRVQPERSGGAQPGARRGQGRGHPDRLGRRLRHRIRTPTTSTTTRWSTRSSAPSGCSSSSAATAPCTTCAVSPVTRPTATVTSASRRSSKDYPGIKVVPNADGVATGWDPATTTTLINDFIASGQYDDIQGIWTSGMDSQVVDAIKGANKPFVPIVGADLGAFVNQLLTETEPQGRRGHQHRRRRWRGRQPGAPHPPR